MTKKTPAISDVDAGQLGPAMIALNPRQRAFIQALILMNSPNHTKAAIAAGYSAENAAVQGWRLAHDSRVLAAIKEETDRRIRSSVIIATRAVEEIAANPQHKDQLKAATLLLNKGGFKEVVQQEVRHIHEMDVPQIEARLKVLNKLLKNDHGAEEVVEDATFTEVDTEQLKANEDWEAW